MKTNFFEGHNVSDHEKLITLQSECVGTEVDKKFKRPYTEEEKKDLELGYINNAKVIAKKEEILAERTKPLKDQISALKKENNQTMKEISSGGVYVMEDVYLFPDLKNQKMAAYDQTGNLVEVRPMTRSERQLHINSFKNQEVDNG